MKKKFEIVKRKSIFIGIFAIILIIGIILFKFDFNIANISSNISKSLFNVGAISFRNDNKITSKLIFKKSVDDVYSKAINVQGMTSDGKYYYIAFLSKRNEKYTDSTKVYTKQTTVLAKINSKGKVVARINLGKIGHSNGIAYNPNTKKIIFAPCNRANNFLYQIDANFNKNTKKEKVVLKKDGKNYLLDDKGKVSKTIASVGYNTSKNEYAFKISNKKLAIFDNNFNFVREVVTSKLLKNSNSLTGQAIYTDGDYIYSVYNNLSKRPYQNYINIFNYSNGQFVRKISLGSSITKFGYSTELESIIKIGNSYYANGNYSGRVVLIKLGLIN